ncbi:YcaO-like family protein [Nonomuraea typhae]|uniref:YcaO-like family protein n=1 Tax=Nonomuraea typhae TaxID=2603600 RepID=UPI001CA4F408|nr:YcaO-like family protein [Nonomuraea typhae]
MIDLTSLDRLVSPYGVVSMDWDSTHEPVQSEVATILTSIGSGQPGVGAPIGKHITCAGIVRGSTDLARFVGIAEGAERYSAADILGEERIWATARELAGECLEPERYPRCSEREYAAPDCPIGPFDVDASVRWVRGLDLHSRKPTWVPAAMATYNLHRVEAERFVYPISTGYAVHTDPVEAVVRGICEVVERDIISVLWLQKLALPTLGPEPISDVLAESIEWSRRHFVRTHLFDATTDIGVPTVYCLLACEYDDKASRMVGAGTGRTLGEAAEKAFFEAIHVPHVIHRSVKPPPSELAGFDHIADGSRYMGLAERAPAFDFLLKDERHTTANPRMPDDPDEALAWLSRALERADMRAVVVDRTPRELAEVGLHAVNVVIPDLQPMSLVPDIQFKGHPRLYEAPARMGYPVLPEEELNPWPQPFA